MFDMSGRIGDWKFSRVKPTPKLFESLGKNPGIPDAFSPVKKVEPSCYPGLYGPTGVAVVPVERVEPSQTVAFKAGDRVVCNAATLGINSAFTGKHGTVNSVEYAAEYAGAYILSLILTMAIIRSAWFHRHGFRSKNRPDSSSMA